MDLLFMCPIKIGMMDQMKHYKDVAQVNTPTHIPKKYARVNLTNGNVKIIVNVLILIKSATVQ